MLESSESAASRAPCRDDPPHRAPLDAPLCASEPSPSSFTVWRDDTWDEARAASASARLAATGPVLPRPRLAQHARQVGRAWDAYYASHGDQGFRDRHYLERDFPQLLARGGGVDVDVALLELGCGVGNAFFPLLAAAPRLFVTAFDLSRRAMVHIAEHPLAASGRVCAFAHNACDGGTAAAVAAAHAAWARDGGGAAARGATAAASGTTTAASAPYRRVRALASFAAAADVARAAPAAAAAPLAFFRGFDAALVLFMASALPPEALAGVFHEAATCLAPGGVLLFRDYAAFDEAELRFRAGRRLGEHLFLRSDGTLAGFFTLAQVTAAAARAGLEVVEARYLYRAYSNRATGQLLRRIFLHAVLRAPGTCAALGGVPAAPAAGAYASNAASGDGGAWAAGLSEYEWVRLCRGGALWS